jgi:hypothetical protein
MPLSTRVLDARGNPIPETELQSAREYKAGRALEDCLTQGCQVFWAVVTELVNRKRKLKNQMNGLSSIERSPLT